MEILLASEVAKATDVKVEDIAKVLVYLVSKKLLDGFTLTQFGVPIDNAILDGVVAFRTISRES